MLHRQISITCPAWRDQQIGTLNYMSKFKQSIDRFYPENRAAWRAWLKENHATSLGIWLVHYKKNTGKPAVT